LSVEFYLKRLDSDDRPTFECGDTDLNEFFSTDSVKYHKELISITYAAMCPKTNSVLGFFSVSNDAVRKEDAPNPSVLKRIMKPLNRAKRFSSTPAVKIGRLAICEKMKGNGLGTQLLDFIKVSFTTENKTGCRFIIVDAYKTATGFYERNGFELLSSKKEPGTTDLMYFDLINFVR